jgi:hypothetical protein
MRQATLDAAFSIHPTASSAKTCAPMPCLRPSGSTRRQRKRSRHTTTELPSTLVDGNRLTDVKILQDAAKLLAVMKDGPHHNQPDVAGAPQRRVA